MKIAMHEGGGEAMSERFVIEGEWTDYHSGQQRIVHREVYPKAMRKLKAWVEKNPSILYTDGTSLLLSVRDCKPRERVQEIRAYSKLIKDCFYADVTSVAYLSQAARETTE